MKQYHDYLRHILTNGTAKGDRTGTGAISTLGYQMRFDLKEGFPLLTTKRTWFKGIVVELLWFLRGDTNIRYLLEHGVSFWSDWPFARFAKATGIALPTDENGRILSGADEYKDAIARFEERVLKDKAFAEQWGSCGPVYGHQWRRWGTGRSIPIGMEQSDDADGSSHSRVVYGEEVIDQIQQVIDTLRTRPDDRRMIVSAWNVAEIEEMSLPACHCFFQFWTRELSEVERTVWGADRGLYGNLQNHERLDRDGVPRRALSCQMYQRSVDSFLGLPFNIASYALLTHMIAQQVDMIPDEFIWVGGDCHIYLNHVDQVEELLGREPRELPQLRIERKPETIDDYRLGDFKLIGYHPHEKIEAEIAV